MIGRFVYVIGDEGAVDIFRMRDPNHYDHVGRTNTAAGARTGLFVSGLDRLFVAVPHRGSQAARLLVYQIGQSVRWRANGLAKPDHSAARACDQDRLTVLTES
jgi:hypothetical protein